MWIDGESFLRVGSRSRVGRVLAVVTQDGEGHGHVTPLEADLRGSIGAAVARATHGQQVCSLYSNSNRAIFRFHFLVKDTLSQGSKLALVCNICYQKVPLILNTGVCNTEPFQLHRFEL